MTSDEIDKKKIECRQLQEQGKTEEEIADLLCLNLLLVKEWTTAPSAEIIATSPEVNNYIIIEEEFKKIQNSNLTDAQNAETCIELSKVTGAAVFE